MDPHVRHARVDSTRRAFVAMPFSADDQRRFTGVFAPALEAAGFVVERGDHVVSTNPITLDIEKSLVDCDLVLCDLTGLNPNVFYEMALAHVVSKPVILVSPVGQPIPFDVSHIRAVLYDISTVDWEALLTEAIAATASASTDCGATSPLELISREFSRRGDESVKQVFRLFKSTVAVLSDSGAKFRLHFLRYDARTDVLSMAVQDDVYRDRSFSIGVSDGSTKGLVVCDAFAGRRLIQRSLPADHFTFYSDSAIPERLSCVMAAPVVSGSETPRGVVSLDSKTPFEELGMDADDLEELFLRLCEVVAEVVEG